MMWAAEAGVRMEWRSLAEGLMVLRGAGGCGKKLRVGAAEGQERLKEKRRETNYLRVEAEMCSSLPLGVTFFTCSTFLIACLCANNSTE